MTVPGNLSSPLLATAAAAAAGVNITKSVRFNKADTAYCDKTFSSAGTTGTTTFSAWVKRAALGVQQSLISVTESGNYAAIQFNDDDQLVFNPYSTSYGVATSDAKFRDPAAWLHVVVIVEVSNSTSADRLRLYVNNERLSTASYTAPTAGILTKALEHRIGLSNSTSHPLGAYLGPVHLIDGQALEPTSFGAYDDNGVWQAAAYSGTFGTNGFHLFDFASESTVGHDSSGNENDFTANNISTSAGAGNDVLFDVPTNGTQSDTGAGGEVSGNYCTFNPLGSVLTYASFSNGNLDHVASNNASHFSFASGTIAFNSADTTGFYFEVTQTTYGQYSTIGLHDVAYQLTAATTGAAIGSGATNGPMGITYSNTGTVYNFGTSISSQPTYTAAGDVIGVAVKGNKIWFAKNNSWISGDPSTGTSPTATLSASKNLTPCITGYNSGEFSLNAGQRAFSYSAPTGFKALCTTNLPTPTIADGSDYFEARTYNGDTTTSQSGFEFSPDFLWLKSRSNNDTHFLFDTVRGTTKYLSTTSTGAEGTQSASITSFDSDGFSYGSWGPLKNSSMIAWCWDAGTSNASNTDGTITSTVRANIAAGFSVVTYTGNGTYNSQIGHGLGVSPHLLIVKSRSTTGDWAVYTRATGSQKYLLLNSTAAAATDSGYWAYNTPETSVFRVGANANVNANGTTYVAYCFAPVAGFSAFGSYDGNGSTDGPFVYTGFRPRFILQKTTATETYGSWHIYDTARDPYNAVDNELYADSSSQEGSIPGGDLDILSNGFKIRTNFAGGWNTSNTTYIYAAFAENPFQANGGLAR